MIGLALPSAKTDLADGFALYEDQGEGLGDQCLESRFCCISDL
jgi:hypothetical protein